MKIYIVDDEIEIRKSLRNILEDEKGIEVLSASKLKSNEIAEK
jgi:DNA-binding NtrC family response regulator